MTNGVGKVKVVAGWQSRVTVQRRTCLQTRDETLASHLGRAAAEVRCVPRSSPAATRRAAARSADLHDLLRFAAPMLIDRTRLKPRQAEGGGPP